MVYPKFSHLGSPFGQSFTSDRVLLQTPLEVDSIKGATFHGLLHILLKDPAVCLELNRSLLVEGILRVRFQEEILKTIDYGVDCQHWFPVLSENVETDVALEVDVRVVNLRLALHLWWFVGICGSYFEGECEYSAPVEALIGVDDKLEVEQIVNVGELCLAGLRKLQLIQVLGDPELCCAGSLLGGGPFISFLLLLSLQ